MIRVESLYRQHQFTYGSRRSHLYDSSDRVSSSAIASSKACLAR